MTKPGSWGNWATIQDKNSKPHENIDKFDKYAAMIAESKLSSHKNVKKYEKKPSLMEDIKICNFIKIWNVKGENEHCLCGGPLNFFDSVEVRYHKHGKMTSVNVPGKKCMDCSRKFVVKGIMLQEISNNG